MSFQLAPATECIKNISRLPAKHTFFQLALTTECIELGRDFRNALRSFNSHSLRSVSPIHLWNRWISYLSTRTHYGAYPSVSVVSLHPAPFNSHSLRIVSSCLRVLHIGWKFSTRTHYGVYHNILTFKFLDKYFSTRTHYGVYQQNGLILCFKICHFFCIINNLFQINFANYTILLRYIGANTLRFSCLLHIRTKFSLK